MAEIALRRGAIASLAMLAAVGLAHVKSASAAELTSPSGAVVLETHGYGWRLTDKNGMVLYTYGKDEPGKSKCAGRCTDQWRPLAGTAEDKAEGDWSKIERPENTLQWAYKGSPLYSFTGDKRAGDANGEDLERGAWKVAVKPLETPSDISVVSTPRGYVLADERGMTLYSSERDGKNKLAACDIKCARQWLPKLAPWTAVSQGDWSVVAGADGTKQWAYKEQPLYLYRGEVNPAETEGDGLGKNWHAVVLEKPLPVPSWLTVQAASSNINIYADPKGMTMYMHFEAGVTGGSYPGKDILRPQDWVPVVADANAQPIGDWSVVTREDGTHQWAYKGNKVYTNVNDKKPGDLNGVRRFDLTFRPISVTGKVIAGTGA